MEQQAQLGAEITMEYINKRINDEYCDDTAKLLTDEHLMDEYKKSTSVRNEITKLSDILDSENISEESKQEIIRKYLPNLIPAGTKGVIRGNKFNSIIKNKIIGFNMEPERFEVCFEEQCKSCITSEIPDWYVLEKKTGKVIIGMNQLDLWGGGQQINRGSKYLINNKNNTEKSKLLCVVCNKIIFNSNKNKVYKLFEIGYSNNTLCYIKNIESIINKFFN